MSRTFVTPRSELWTFGHGRRHAPARQNQLADPSAGMSWHRAYELLRPLPSIPGDARGSDAELSVSQLKLNNHPPTLRQRSPLASQGITVMTKLDWKWIAIGLVIMVVLSLLGGLLLGLILRPQIEGAASPDEISLGGGGVALALVVNVLSFLIGGFIVGVKSAGRTILEPGISALIAVILVLVISQQLTAMNVLIGGLVPFVAGVVGGWLGEKRSAKP